MSNVILSVREMQHGDLDPLINYWLSADDTFLRGLGVDVSKMPAENEWRSMLTEQLNTPIEDKKSYCIIWVLNGVPVGHSNINKIIFGEEAYMHLHMWNSDVRQQGHGTAFVRLTVPYFFENYKLKKLFCEPYALNPAPNKTLTKAGFKFVKEFITTPGWLNFEQPVNLWEMSHEEYEKLKKTNIQDGTG